MGGIGDFNVEGRRGKNSGQWLVVSEERKNGRGEGEKSGGARLSQVGGNSAIPDLPSRMKIIRDGTGAVPYIQSWIGIHKGRCAVRTLQIL